MYALVIAGGIYFAFSLFDVQMATATFLILVLANLLKQVGKVQKQYQRMAIYESAFWALDETISDAEGKAEVMEGTQPPHFEKEITLEGVAFSYGDHNILSETSLSIPAGALTCLVGSRARGRPRSLIW